MPTSLQRDADIKLEELAKQFEISGASILNAVQYAALQTYARNNGVICQQDLIDGVRKEYQKEDKSF
jgi:ATP-dependent 26S proteasome regulatory subunit